MITDEEKAADFCAANPGKSVIAGRVHRDAAGYVRTLPPEWKAVAGAPEPDPATPTVLMMIEQLQRHLGLDEYRTRVDKIRRPDDETITVSMRNAIERLYREVLC